MKLNDLFDSIIYHSIKPESDYMLRVLVYEIYSNYFGLPVGSVFKPILFE